jgi:hypothetical protein
MLAMLMKPAAQPPLGVESNFDHPESRVDMTIGLISTVLVLMTIAVSLRVYARAMITNTFGWEDCKYRRVEIQVCTADNLEGACILAAVLNIGYAAVAFVDRFPHPGSAMRVGTDIL